MESVRPQRPWRPTKEQLAAAYGRSVPDVITRGQRLWFVGINPGLYTAAIGHHFGHPGNRFWKALHMAGFTARELSPFEEGDLLDAGLGITNLVERATRNASELSAEELRKGARRLERKVRRYRPRVLAFCGMDMFRVAYGKKDVRPGPQPGDIAGAGLWVLPNPSGLNASYQLPALVAEMRRLRKDVDRRERSSGT